jgi:OPA family glycerol-3-phosphate transporter-like MFS transporter
MIKINTAWFHRKERGRFAGIFGFMINLGRFGINSLGPAILAGFVIVGLIHVPPQHWRWVFFVPAMICAAVAVLMALVVKQTPEDAGFHRPDPTSRTTPTSPTAARRRDSHHRRQPGVWICALAYAAPARSPGHRPMVPALHERGVPGRHEVGAVPGAGVVDPIVATLGSLSSGYISDIFFAGRARPWRRRCTAGDVIILARRR